MAKTININLRDRNKIRTFGGFKQRYRPIRKDGITNH